MNILLIAYTSAFVVSMIIKNENTDYFLKSFLFSILFTLFIITASITKINFTIIFLLSESLFLLLTIVNNKSEHKIFTSLLLSVFSIFTLGYILNVLTLNTILIIFTLLIVTNYILIKKDDKKIKLFFTVYFLSTYSLLYTEFINEIIISLTIFKLIIIILLINNAIKEYKMKMNFINKRITKLENDFDKSVLFEAQRRTLSLERINTNALKKAKTDKLTSTLNKEGILAKIDSFIDDKRIRTFSILFFDIDKFKTINDTFGHNTGDKALKSLANNIHSIMRDDDYFGRYGGDEFIILLKDTTTTETFMIANRYREYVSKNSTPPFTISIGFSTYPNDGVTVKSLLEIADNGLYHSKEEGRNIVSYTGTNTMLD